MNGNGPGSCAARWDARIARATDLAGRHPDAAGLLTFYASLARYQRSVAGRWASAIDRRPGRGFPECLDTQLILDAVPETLSWLAESAPAGLAAAAEGMLLLDANAWRLRLDELVASHGSEAGPESPGPVFVLETLLQPLAEQLAEAEERPAGAGSNRCPFCGGLPVAGVLREEGQGAKRLLLCGLCLTEWTYLRVVCPGCGERSFDALPVYTAERFESARIDSCDTCRKYLKTIDATKDGHVVPIVDDLASVSLDLWARAQGYARLREHLLRP